MSRPDPRAVHAEHEIERAYTAKLARHENEVRRIERERFLRRLSALCPGSSVPDPEFPGCVWDSAPYPAPIYPEAA